MWAWEGIQTFNVVTVLIGENSEYFNYFFTLTTVFGMFSFGIGILVKIVSRS